MSSVRKVAASAWAPRCASRSAALLAVAASVALLPGLAQASSVAEAHPLLVGEDGVAVATPLLLLDVSPQGDLLLLHREAGSRLGDDTYELGQTVQAVEATVDTADLPVVDTLDHGVVLQATLRQTEVQHPVFHLLRGVARDLLPPGGPVEVWIGDEGVDYGWDTPLGQHEPGNSYVPYPNQRSWYVVPVESDSDSVAVEESYVQSSDALVAQLTRPNRDTPCLAASYLAGVDDCRTEDLYAVLDSVAPNVILYNELQDLKVGVNGFVENAASVLPLGGASGPGTVVGEKGVAGPAGGQAEWARADQPLAAPVDGAAGGIDGGDAAEESWSLASAMGPPPAWVPALVAVAVAVGLAALAVPLYRRLVRGQVLEHGVRSRLLEVVRQEPGLHESAVAERLGISHTLAQYHVRLLAEFGLLEVRRFGGRKCLFGTGQLGTKEKMMVLADKGTSAQVVDLVAAQPGIAQRELARALGIRESSVKWHLDRLEAQGVVTVERTVDGKRMRLTDDATQGREAVLARAAPVTFERVPATALPEAAPPAATGEPTVASA